MHRHGAVRLTLAVALAFLQASAKLITITEYPTSCKAIYTSGSVSTTVVQSTIIAEPTPWTDHDANNGTPFVLEVIQSRPRDPRKRDEKARILVRPDGKSTTSIEEAAKYIIDEEGRLTSVDGGFISTDERTRHEIFALSEKIRLINTDFKVYAGSLDWVNEVFPDKVAYFYRTQAQRIVVRFSGPIRPDWEAVSLAARSVNNATTGGSKSQTSRSVSHSPSTSSSATSRHPYHTWSSSGNTERPSISHSGYPAPSEIVSPNGRCGGSKEYTCLGSEFGDCCSLRGHCSTGKRYCEAGCQPLFGICWAFSPTPSGTGSMLSSASASWPATIQVSIPSRSPSTAVSSSSISSYSTSTYLTPASPIGPINPLSHTLSTSDSRMSSSSSAKSTHSGHAAVSSSAPVAPPCPTSAESLCGSPDNSATCSSSGGVPYNASCGVAYVGTEIDTSNIVGLPPLRKRAIEGSLADCQTLCDRYPNCLALNYIGTNCTLLSEVTGTKSVPGAVGAAVPVEYVPAKMNPPSSSSPKSTFSNNTAASTKAHMGMSASSTENAVSSSTSEVVNYSSASEMLNSMLHPSTEIPVSSSSVMKMSTRSEILWSTSSAFVTSSSTLPATSYGSTSIPSKSISDISSNTQVSTVVSSTAATSSGLSSTSTIATSLTSAFQTASTANASPSSTYVSSSSNFASSRSSAASSIATFSSTATSSSAITTATNAPSRSSPLASSSTTASSVSLDTGFPILPSPTPCDFGGDEANSDEDDSYCRIQLPFQMQIYSQKDRNTFASTNGYISIQRGSAQYSNQQFPASNLASNTVAPFFDDLYLSANSTPKGGIYYQIGNGALTYEYYLTRGGKTGDLGANEAFHFTVHYDSAQPGVFIYTYYETGGPGDNGIFAAVGMQGLDPAGSPQGFTYSFQSASITPGLVVRCDTQANTCVTVRR